MTWFDTYRRHLRSSKWRYLKARVVNSRGQKCERCGARFGLQLHHKTYQRLGDELPSDVELLCKPCHTRADLRRMRQNIGVSSWVL